MTVQPKFLNGQVSSYKGEAQEFRNQGQIVSFDFLRDYTEELLVHHSNGRQKRRNALIALSYLTVKHHLLDELSVRLGVLGDHYHAFHVRHTDYKTDFESKVLALAPHITGRVFLATDNKSVVDFFVRVFGQDRLTTFSTLPEKAGEPLHSSHTSSSFTRRNNDAILDLLTLALADKYHFFPREFAGFNMFGAYSGFSALAARLRFSPDILRSLLSSQFGGRIKSPSFVDRVLNLRWRYF